MEQRIWLAARPVHADPCTQRGSKRDRVCFDAWFPIVCPLSCCTAIYQLVLPAEGFEVAVLAAPKDHDKVLQEELLKPFKPFSEPPLRAVLLQSQASSRLVLIMHHVAVDLRAMGILRSELEALCQSLAQELPTQEDVQQCAVQSHVLTSEILSAWAAGADHARRESLLWLVIGLLLLTHSR